MIVYKVKGHEVVETECEEFGWPHRDKDFDQMYINTHFLTKDEAYQNLIDRIEASISLHTRELLQARRSEREIEKKIANHCIDKERAMSEWKQEGQE